MLVQHLHYNRLLSNVVKKKEKRKYLSILYAYFNLTFLGNYTEGYNVS